MKSSVRWEVLEKDDKCWEGKPGTAWAEPPVQRDIFVLDTTKVKPKGITFEEVPTKRIVGPED